MLTLIPKAVLYCQGLIGLRRHDVLIASFPKSGNTWVRFFFCNLLSLSEWGGRQVDFTTVDSTLPELGADNLLHPWPYRSIPRIVKTHKNYWPFFKNVKTVFVYRDPRDVMVSFFHFEAARKQPRFSGNFTEFLHHRKFGLESWFRHYRSWQNHKTVSVSYEALKRSDVPEFGRMLQGLGISISSGFIGQAAERSKFERVREAEIMDRNSKLKELRKGQLFTRDGKTGKWQEYFTDEDIRYFYALRDKYNPEMRFEG